MGDSYATTLPESGWIQLTDTGDVLDAAGIPGRMLVLKADCSLWEAGAGAGQTMRRISDLGAVVQIASYGQALYVLTADGGLYESGYGSYYYSAGNAWNSVANDVVAFQVCSAGAVWLTSENTIGSNFACLCRKAGHSRRTERSFPTWKSFRWPVTAAISCFCARTAVCICWTATPLPLPGTSAR